jgi:hypothetical protein
MFELMNPLFSKNKKKPKVKVVSIIIPKKNNEGQDFNPTLLESIESAIIDAAGSYSKYAIQGAWKDQNKTYFDNNIKYDIIINDPASEKNLIDLAFGLKTVLCQESILVESTEKEILFL